MTHLLYCQYFNKTRLKVINLAPSMIIFLFTHVICATLEMPYHVYLVWKWNPKAVGAYDPYVLYWTGLWNEVYFQLISLSVLFLSLDRLLAIKFPFHYNYNCRIKRWMPGVTICLFPSSYI
ncbi:hypothetical protein DdX_16431 [Ditylenchus destructor]|uniref:Uncharacterized protein n=1 Tax=Ditylenchus destructor TaxID=166010 RepID=A0AAD4MPM6_9BILA|nr:hypothetical protein DdX_16431 [Ditylenchus destructor]